MRIDATVGRWQKKRERRRRTGEKKEKDETEKGKTTTRSTHDQAGSTGIRPVSRNGTDREGAKESNREGSGACAGVKGGKVTVCGTLSGKHVDAVSKNNAGSDRLEASIVNQAWR